MILGVTGYIAAGKDEFCKILERKGFKHISLSDLLREILEEQGKEKSRENLTKLGSELREKEGDGALAKKALKKVKEGNWLVSSIGRVAEAEELRKNTDFKLIFITASQETRFERIKSRKRKGDTTTLEEFKKQEEREAKGKNKYREFDNLKEKADIIIENNDTIKELERKAKEVIN